MAGQISSVPGLSAPLRSAAPTRPAASQADWARCARSCAAICKKNYFSLLEKKNPEKKTLSRTPWSPRAHASGQSDAAEARTCTQLLPLQPVTSPERSDSTCCPLLKPRAGTRQGGVRV